MRKHQKTVAHKHFVPNKWELASSSRVQLQSVHVNFHVQVLSTYEEMMNLEIFCPYFQVDFFGAHEHNADGGFFYLGYQLTGRKKCWLTSDRPCIVSSGMSLTCSIIFTKWPWCFSCSLMSTLTAKDHTISPMKPVAGPIQKGIHLFPLWRKRIHILLELHTAGLLELILILQILLTGSTLYLCSHKSTYLASYSKS